MDNEEYAAIELQHIVLEIKYRRYHHLRHFVDSYMCYRMGFVNRNGKANPDAHFRHGFMTREARRRALSNREHKKSANHELRKEHVVPLSFITDKFKGIELNGRSDTDIAGAVTEILDQYFLVAIVTRSEDKRLSHKYSNCMPEALTQGRDISPWQRYKEVGLLSSIKHFDNLYGEPVSATEYYKQQIEKFDKQREELVLG